MKTKQPSYVNKTGDQTTEKAVSSEQKEAVSYSALSLEEQLELFADLIVEQLLKEETK